MLRPVGYLEPHGWVRLVQSAYVGAGAVVMPLLVGMHAGSRWFDASFDLSCGGALLRMG